MRNEDFIQINVEKARAMQRATEFIKLGARSIHLRGWYTAYLCELIASGSKKTMEAIVLTGTAEQTREKGDIVTIESVFPSSAGVIWEKNSIFFQSKEGVVTNVDEYAYIQKNGLNGNQFFASTETKDGDPISAWKQITRRTAQARKDKSKEILNLALSTLLWQPIETDSKGTKATVKSPLLICGIKETSSNSKELRFNIASQTIKINSILAREIKKQFFIDIFDGCPNEFEFSAYPEIISRIKSNVEQSPDITLCENDLHICLLDSSNETICQSVERNASVIAESNLIGVFAQNATYEPKYDGRLSAEIFPLPADDSQREVVSRVLSGDSVNVHAGPGTGKSQTVVNCAANVLLQGKTLCMMAEKAAANEVFLSYAKTAGLGKYCLLIKETTTSKDIISQIKLCVASLVSYVDTEAARSVIAAYRESDEDIKNLNRIYENIPDIGTNLYQIIGEASQFEDLDCSDYIAIQSKNYQLARQKLSDLQGHLIDTMSDAEWNTYVTSGSSGDEEQDEMLDEAITELERIGLRLKECVCDKNIAKSDVCAVLVSQLARITAEKFIEGYDLKKYGNRRLKMLYKKLLEASSDMNKLASAFLLQELSSRTANAAKDSKFVELLDRLATAKISLSDLFKTYGKDILDLCPILVTTPNALVNFDNLNIFDVLFIDESSQMPFTNVLPFIVRDRQLVVFGDPMQLDITSFWTKTDVFEQEDDEEFDLSKTDKSILHVVQGKIPSCQLQYHYRSKTEHLLAVSNATCYDGLLNIAPDIYKSAKELPSWLGYEVLRISNPMITTKGGNQTEAEAIVGKLITIRREYPEKTVGIITFNEKQQDAIWDEIDAHIETDSSLSKLLSLDDDTIWLRTLENSQGKEADVVIVSIGHARRNNDGAISKAISEICKDGGLNRLNVLFTRAREKIVIAISFDYRELKDSDNAGVLRLYDYLHYAVTGECLRVETDDSLKDRYNVTLTEKVETLCSETKAESRIGRGQMSVDVGVGDITSGSYRAGILFSNSQMTANAICTKVVVLERAGWNLLPLSPISFFTKPEMFAAQLSEGLSTLVKFNTPQNDDFITATRPSELFSSHDYNFKPALQNAISDSELLEEDFETAYTSVWSSEVAGASERKLAKLADRGDMQARLRLILRKLPDFVSAGRTTELLTAVQKLYAQEKCGCYLYAQLLRAKADSDDYLLINKLLAEAKSIGIKILA